ncbi:MAG: hypothetical protein ABSG83_01080 [Roseiarcus sp.]
MGEAAQMLDRFAAVGPGNLGVLAVEREDDAGHATEEAFDLVADREALVRGEGGVERGAHAALLDPFEIKVARNRIFRARDFAPAAAARARYAGREPIRCKRRRAARGRPPPRAKPCAQ